MTHFLTSFLMILLVVAQGVKVGEARGFAGLQESCQASPFERAEREMINFLLLVSRQGKVRLSKWYDNIGSKEKLRATRELTSLVLSRPPKMCNFLEWRDKKVVYKRYASLFFVACVDRTDNELITLEMIHLFVEILDRYFGNVCELDIIFNFHKAYYILDELFIGGQLQETSKNEILRICSQLDEQLDEQKEEGGAAPKKPR